MSGTESISVLHVDDDEEVGELTELYLERVDDDLSVATESDPERALERLEEEDVDCIVSDYNMPGLNGIEFLEAVRSDDPELPFILFTGRGSEEIASEAISAGVTDYLQKERGTDQYTVLANRIKNAVGKHRAEQAVEEQAQWYSTILAHSSDFVVIVDERGAISYVSPAIERVLGYEPSDVVGDNAFEFVHPEDKDSATETLADVVTDPNRQPNIEFRATHADGSYRWLETRGNDLRDQPPIEGVLVNVRDITVRKRREQNLERQRNQLVELSSFMSHDVRNQLNVVDTRLNLIAEETDSEHLDAALDGLDRIGEMIQKTMELAQGGHVPEETQTVNLAALAEQSHEAVTVERADLLVESSLSFEADEKRLSRLLENLFINAVDHGSTADAEQVVIRVGELPDAEGFYVEDNGPGIPEDVRERMFETGYTTAADGTGLGLAIVNQVAKSHGWSISVTDGSLGGARFEFTGVRHDDGPERLAADHSTVEHH